MKLKQRKTVSKISTQLPHVDLHRSPLDWSAYRDEIRNIYERQCIDEHCEEYEELTMEEKLLVDADVEFLMNEEFLSNDGLLFFRGIDRYTLEKYLARLRKRDRKNDKRN